MFIGCALTGVLNCTSGCTRMYHNGLAGAGYLRREYTLLYTPVLRMKLRGSVLTDDVPKIVR